MADTIEPFARLQRTIQYLSAVAGQAVGGQVRFSVGSMYATLMDLSAVMASLQSTGQTSTPAAPPPTAGSVETQMATFDAAVQAKMASALAAVESKLGGYVAKPPVVPAPPLDPQQQQDAAMFARILAEPDLKARVKALVDGQPAPAPG